MTGSDGNKPNEKLTQITLQGELIAPWEPSVEPVKPAKHALPDGGIPGYTLGKILGRGGMGVVMAASRVSDGKAVAMKLLRSDVASDTGFTERFLREVAVMKEVRHQNVVGIIDSGEITGWLWMALELMPDGDLERYLRPRGQLFEKDALGFAIKIARGLVALHEVGLLHRDIKPQNIFLNHKSDDGGDVKVGDLGMARHASGGDRMTMTGTACGTPAYMAPEQIRGLADVDARVDVYALGVLLYTLLAGTEPFVGDTVFTVSHAILNDPIPDLRRANPNVSAAVVGIIRTAMAKDRTQRFATMADMLRDLEAVAHGALPVHASVISPVAASEVHAARGQAPVPSALAGNSGGISLPGLGLIVRIALVLMVIVVPLTMLPNLFDKRLAGDGAPSGGKRVAPARDSHGSYCIIRAGSRDFIMRWCPPGACTIGSPPEESGRAPWENPHHVQFTRGCWMLENEVSQAQYLALVGNNPSKHPDPNLPVDTVTIGDAERFLAALNHRVIGLGARLPSEAEWEYACRAGNTGAFSSAPTQEALLSNRDVLAAWDRQPIDAAPNYEALNSALRWVDGTAKLGPRPVAQGQPNPWGIVDLHGNVQEWCRDRWDHVSLYAREDSSDPLTSEGPLAVVRGGSWAHPAERSRSASRDAQDPETAWPWIGFRFVVPGGSVPEPLPTN